MVGTSGSVCHRVAEVTPSARSLPVLTYSRDATTLLNVAGTISAGKFHFEPPSLAHLRVRAPRQAHGEHRAFADLARNRHIAAHQARELAGDGKAEPRAPETLCSRGIGLGELLEQLGLLFPCHADPGVGHGKLDPVASVCHPARPQRDLALLGELKGIAQQVEQYLP